VERAIDGSVARSNDISAQKIPDILAGTFWYGRSLLIDFGGAATGRGRAEGRWRCS